MKDKFKKKYTRFRIPGRKSFYDARETRMVNGTLEDNRYEGKADNG